MMSVTNICPTSPKRRRNSVFSDEMNHDDDDRIAAERRRLFDEAQKRDNRIQQALTAARKRMESGRGAIEHMMLEETAREQKMQRLESEVAELRDIVSQRDTAIALLNQTVIKEREEFRDIVSQRDMAIAMLTQTVIKEREQSRNERALFFVAQRTPPRAAVADAGTNTERTTADMGTTTDTLSDMDEESPAVVSRKRKRVGDIPTPPRSDIAAFEGDSGIGMDDFSYVSDEHYEDAPVVSSSPALRRVKSTVNLRPSVHRVDAETVALESSRGPTSNPFSSPGGVPQKRTPILRRRAKAIPLVRVYNLRPRKYINYKV
ncbi:hypothetical protein PG995_011271 [Apiospora arundinis]|uniref:Shugoshin n=1 Tax=Apiospora arundinis TaxID=335852 RepID=A0ABR2IUV6_9PEZI